MLKVLKDIKPEKLIYLDIETRAQVAELDESSDLFTLAEYTVSRRDDFEDNQQIHDYYKSKAALIPELGAICCISVGFIHSNTARTTSFYGENEKELLINFTGFMLEIQDKFTAVAGFASNDFDIPYIITRMWANGIFNIPSIIDESNEKPWTCKNFDLKQAVRMGRPVSPSLLGLCTTLGVPSPKDGISGKEVSQAFFEGRLEEIKVYCEKDVTATINCLLVLQGREVLPQNSVAMEKSYGDKEYASELDKLFSTEELDVEALAKEGAKLTKKEQDMYLKLVDTLKIK